MREALAGDGLRDMQHVFDLLNTVRSGPMEPRGRRRMLARIRASLR